MSLLEEVATRLVDLTDAGELCLIAVSGGPDSLALLDVLHRGAALHGRPLVVGHVDHGISPESGVVAGKVVEAAAARGLRCVSVQLHLGPACSETRARTARRTALREIAEGVGATAIVLAHHADDQVETVLLRLFRGSGPAGLAGMAPRVGPWVRPLLTIPRSQLTELLSAQGLSGWQDPANRDPRHLRSWLRMELLPALAARLPDVKERILESADQAREARLAWEELPNVMPELALEAAPDGISVAAPPLKGYRSGLRHAVVAALGRRLEVPLGSGRLAAVDRLLHGRGGTIRIAATLEAELAFGRLILRRPSGAGPAPVLLVAGSEAAFGGWGFSAKIAEAPGLDREGASSCFVPGRYLVRTWQEGDRIRPLGGRGHRSVSVLLRESKIAPGRRGHWPVVVAEDATIVWVPGICRSDACIPTEGSEALCVIATDS